MRGTRDFKSLSCGTLEINYEKTPFFLISCNTNNSLLLMFKSSNEMECSYNAERPDRVTIFKYHVTVTINKYIDLPITDNYRLYNINDIQISNSTEGIEEGIKENTHSAAKFIQDSVRCTWLTPCLSRTESP